MGDDVQIDVQVQDGITPDLNARLARLADKRPVLEAMGQAVVSLAKRAFTQPGIRPAPWAKRKKTYGHPILMRSKDLWQSLFVGNITNESATVGTPKTYAAVQQFGSKKKEGRGSGIPPRPFMPILGTPDSPQWTERAKKAVENAARRQIAAAMK